MRISIIGHSASGKSTLARNISARLGIPHLHLDRVWIEAGGHTVPRSDHAGRERVKEKVRDAITQLVAQDAWVSDGWYGRSQPIIAERADRILFLDIPLWRRVWSHLSRVFRREHRHAEFSFWQDLLFTYELVKRTYTYRPAMRELLAQYEHKVTVLRSHKEIDTHLASLSA